MKQTAVEYLIEQIEELINAGIPQSIIEKAKAIEIEQHKETFKQSRQAKIFEKNMPPVWDSFEQYYNEIYGGDQ